MSDVVQFTREQAQRINAAVRKIEQLGLRPPTGAGSVNYGSILEGFMDEDLDSADSPEEPETGYMKLHRGKGDDWAEHTIDGATEKVKLTNRSETASWGDEEYVMAVPLNGELRPISASGGSVMARVIGDGGGRGRWFTARIVLPADRDQPKPVAGDDATNYIDTNKTIVVSNPTPSWVVVGQIIVAKHVSGFWVFANESYLTN